MPAYLADAPCFQVHRERDVQEPAVSYLSDRHVSEVGRRFLIEERACARTKVERTACASGTSPRLVLASYGSNLYVISILPTAV